VAAAARTLSILNPDWAPPRTARAMASISRALPGAAALHVSGGWSRSEFIPRRADLNRLPDPVAEDQYGRPLYGVLVQRGGLLAAQPGTGRRFTDFEQVSALNVDGWLEWTGVTVEAERRPAAGLRLLAGYTFSRTRDNLLWVQGTAPGDVPSPFSGDAALAGWDEGRSGFDVPHRAVAVAEWRGAGARTPSLALVYRFRSGDPFTAGFRQGVDANGDGSASNDPAYLDPTVSGFSELASAWSCLSGAGGFAVRNGCRGPDVHALDVRAGVDVVRSGAHGVRLTVDGLNLLGGDTGPLDNAVYLAALDRRRGPRGRPAGREPGLRQASPAARQRPHAARQPSARLLRCVSPSPPWPCCCWRPPATACPPTWPWRARARCAASPTWTATAAARSTPATGRCAGSACR
jgi:hypothetical protein